MSVHIAIIATILTVTLWHVDGADVSKSNGYKLEPWLVGRLEKASAHCRGHGMCVQGRVPCGGVYTGSANFINLSLNWPIKNNQMSRVQCIIKIYQS